MDNDDTRTVEQKWRDFFNSLTLVEQRKLAEHQPVIQVPDAPVRRVNRSMLADSVLNENRVTVYMGIPHDVADWLRAQTHTDGLTVKVGVTSKEYSVSEYLAASKFEAVRELVKAAMTRQDVCTRAGDQKPAQRFVDEVTRMIIELL